MEKTYRFCNLRKWKDFNKKQLTLLKMCVTSLLCGPRADLWPFYGFLWKRFWPVDHTKVSKFHQFDFFDRARGNRAYLLQMQSGKVLVYCHMTSIGLGACGGGGATRSISTFQEGRLGSTHMRLSFQPTGAHPSQRSAWVWKSDTRKSSLYSSSKPVPFTHWFLMVFTALPHWVENKWKSLIGSASL